ncbi:Uncharacterised protein [Serratia odorifera]|uniref:Uncharacterized protein n=1 Tax=Serratia odorifera TaxID=618 RepID=A0A447L2D0_SEROD|nr:Uncharacterised protein [Serratia odorifera]
MAIRAGMNSLLAWLMSLLLYCKILIALGKRRISRQ